MRLRRIVNVLRSNRAFAPRTSPIAVINGKPVYPICGAEGEEGADDKGNDDEGKDKKGADSDLDRDDEDSGSDDQPPSNPKEYKAWLKNQELSRENARRRAKNKELADKLAEQQKQLDELNAKDMSELQKAQAVAARAEKTIEELTAKNQKMQIELAFLKLPREKYDWEDASAALTLLMAGHQEDLKLEEDGSVSGLDQAVKDLAKQHKFLLKQPASKNGSTGGDFGKGDDGKSGNKKEEAVSRFRF